MNDPILQNLGPSGSPVVESLCDLILQVSGTGSMRMATSCLHFRVLAEAFQWMNSSQKAVARTRMHAIETRWGRPFRTDKECSENDDIPPETRVARWLSRRPVPARHLIILHRAAQKFADGEKSMTEVMYYAYANETDFVVHPVGQTSFTEWMVELRIGRRVSKGIYAPGSLCHWWVNNLDPQDRKSVGYRACMQQLSEINLRTAHRPRYRC